MKKLPYALLKRPGDSDLWIRRDAVLGIEDNGQTEDGKDMAAIHAANDFFVVLGRAEDIVSRLSE